MWAATDGDYGDPVTEFDDVLATARNDGADIRDTMARLIFGPRILAQVLRCVAEFGVADHLAAGPRLPADLASEAGLDPSATARLLRYCATIGLVQRDVDGRYGGTDLLATLRSGDPHGLRSFAVAQNGPGQWALLSRLDEAVRTGTPQAVPALGRGLYDYYGLPETAGEAAAYREGLAGRGVDLQTALVELIDTSDVDRVLDIGGSVGSMVLALMAANPRLQGAVLDRPDAASAADTAARRLGLSDRFEFIAGDFFSDVPGSDMYLLKNVLGNWDDERCVSILETSRRKALSGSRWIILENAIDETRPSRWSVDVDIMTMVAVGGRVRSVDDYRVLLSRSGLRFVRNTPTASGFEMIEAELSSVGSD